MYFKRLEIIGFKSFLEKTTLKFEPGVTAIVGPNGCGKSNIVDAIKWVCGEQSPKSMRGSSMQDVIFNGTEKFDPVNMAEASIVLANEERILPVDYDEVIITRRLFRSGESEYLLNKTPVRLMDVRDIIRGTGLGTSSYSVIEQGKMDMVLSSRPEERRYVFEEASGITRYKAKKREALFKLERTNDNLTRISDIIREVERQIKAIERQARKAERYRVCYGELKDLEVRLSHMRLRELNVDGTGVDEETENQRKVSDTLKRERDELHISLAGQRKEFSAILEDLQASQSEVIQLTSDIDKNRHTIEIDKERIEELQRDVRRNDRQIEEATERKEAFKGRVDELELKCGNIGSQRGDKEKEILSAEEKGRNILSTMEQHKHELKINREKTVDIIAEQTQTKNLLIKTDADTRNMMAREKRLKLERSNVERERENVCERLKEAEETVDRITKELEASKQEFDTFNNQYISRQERLSALKDEKSNREKRLNQIRPRMDFLERLISEREGISESGKEIMKRVETGDPGFSGVCGILSEIINVRPGYEESLEAVMGDLSEALVVENRIVAEYVARFLEERSLGSLSFVILDELRELLEGREVRPGNNGTPGDVARIITAKEPYLSALRGMLRDTFVASSPQEAKAFIKGDDFQGRIICEKGEVHQRGMYRSRNYSDKEVVSLFGRREKLEQLRAEEKEVEDELLRMEHGVNELEEWFRGSDAKKRELENTLREKQIEFADLSSKRSVIKEKFDTLAEELLLLDAEIEEDAETMRQMREESARSSSKLEELENEGVGIEQRIEISQEVIQQSASEREKVLYRISDIKAELSAIKKEEEHISDNLKRERDTYTRIDREIEEKRARIAENSERIRELDREAEALDAKNVEYAALKETRISENSEKQEEKDSLTRRIDRMEEEGKEKEEKLEAIRNHGRDLDIKRKEVEYKRSALIQRISDAYKVDLTVLEMGSDEAFDRGEAENKITGLKEKIEKMGEVSLGAVEEHKELEERYSFLTKHRDDLVKGREDIMQAITKINRTTRKMFMETFEAIKREFNVYFKMLFSGGKAELVLEDENDILECGIDIVVRPPGKKLQNIMLLSGGEKAMTAIALIFAIFKVNPSPFCVLDEIDAPLDESNIVRFCRVLGEFLKLSQFIIVTHNRMTIQLADILYGITMQEKGVSKIVSVKFSEETKQPEEEDVTVGV